MKSLITAITVLLCCTCTSVYAKTCTAKDAQAADAAVDYLDNWQAVEKNFRQYRHCDDGSIAEGNSDAIARLLVQQWQTLTVLESLSKADPSFRAYVLHHIDSTLDTKSLKAIQHAASTQCPSSSTALCADLKAAAQRAAR